MAAEPQLLEAAGMVMMAVGDGEAVAGQPWQWCWCRWEAEMRDGVVLSGDCYDGCCGEGGEGRSGGEGGGCGVVKVARSMEMVWRLSPESGRRRRAAPET
ncbi:hypothetical protein Tco_0102368 [Tanacetum coccineum]